MEGNVILYKMTLAVNFEFYGYGLVTKAKFQIHILSFGMFLYG